MKYKTQKKKKQKSTVATVLLIILFVLAAAVFCIAGYKLISALISYDQAKSSYDDIRNIFIEEASQPSSFPSDSTNESAYDPDEPDDGFVWNYARLLEINPEGIGYIRMRGGGDNIIDYPVVQHSDNSYYLDHMFDGTYNTSGAIFMDCDAIDGFDSRYCIIYGHNMRSGSRMFSCLKNYQDPEYFKEHSEIDIYAGDKHYVYKVFAQFQTTVDSFVYSNIYPDDATFMNMISEGLASSAIDAELGEDYFSSESHVITLSTCTDRYDAYLRYVVMLVRDREVASR